MKTKKNLNIAILCHPSYGGSGIMATELGLYAAREGHEVHFISFDRPARLKDYYKNIYFHTVDVPSYPLFDYPMSTISLANKISFVCKNYDIDILHAHYALPFTISAYLAKQMCKCDVKIITTLHGTDISIVGQDKSFYDTVKFSLENSDAITCVSSYLKGVAVKEFEIDDKEIEVIHNFIDPEIFKPLPLSNGKNPFREKDEKIIVHMSNFRPYKNISAVIDIFEIINNTNESRLIMVGEGPELTNARKHVREKGLCSKVSFLGNQTYVERIINHGDLFLFPSLEESFGVALLEAMSSGVNFVASNIGGIPEVAGDELKSCLFNPADIKGMAEYGIKLLNDKTLSSKYSKLSRERVKNTFSTDKVSNLYLDLYKSFF